MIKTFHCKNTHFRRQRYFEEDEAKHGMTWKAGGTRTVQYDKIRDYNSTFNNNNHHNHNTTTTKFGVDPV